MLPFLFQEIEITCISERKFAQCMYISGSWLADVAKSYPAECSQSSTDFKLRPGTLDLKQNISSG